MHAERELTIMQLDDLKTTGSTTAQKTTPRPQLWQEEEENQRSHRYLSQKNLLKQSTKNATGTYRSKYKVAV
jgi:hypothetical protein